MNGIAVRLLETAVRTIGQVGGSVGRLSGEQRTRTRPPRDGRDNQQQVVALMIRVVLEVGADRRGTRSLCNAGMHEPSLAYAIQVERKAIRISASDGACQRSRILVAAPILRPPAGHPAADRHSRGTLSIHAHDNALQRQALMTVDLSGGMDVSPPPTGTTHERRRHSHPLFESDTGLHTAATLRGLRGPEQRVRGVSRETTGWHGRRFT